MLKPFGTCKLCESNRFLNHAGLCKSCNKKEASQAIIGDAFEKQKIAEEAQKEMAKQKAVEPEEKPAEEKSDETDDKEQEGETEDKEKEDEKDSK